MGVLSVKNLEEYRQKYANELAAKEEEIGKVITDEMLTDAIYKKIAGKADVDYYSFYKSFNPDGKFSNIDNYKFATELKDVNDEDVINKAYEELQSKGTVRFKDFVNTFAPKERDVAEDIGYQLMGISLDEPEYSVKEIAEMRGVNSDTDVGLAEVGFAQALARDDSDKAIAAKTVLSDFFGQDVPVRFGPETEELEFLNPTSGQYDLLNKAGLDAGDIARFGTTGAFVIPEIIATVVATGATGAVGGIVTSAVSSAVLETARLALGNELYGINKTEEGFMDYLKKEGRDMAAINAALTTAGFTIPKLYRMVKNLKSFGKINPAEFGGRIESAKDASKLLEKINDRLIQLGTKKKLKFTLGQAGDDPELLALQNAYESNPKYGVKGSFDTFNKEQAEALDTFFLLAGDPYNYKGISGKDPITADQLGKMIQNKIVERLNPRQKILTNALENAETDLTNVVLKLPDGSTKEIGQTIRGVVDSLYDDFDSLYNQKYKTLFELGKGRKVNTDIIKEAVKGLDKRQKETLFKKYPNIRTFFEAPRSKTISVNALKNTLSDLRRFDRQLSKGTIPVEGQPVEGAVSKLIGSIKNQLKKDLGEEDVWYRQFNQLDKEYAANKQLYKGVIGDLISTKDGVLKIADENVFNQTFKKGMGQERRIDQIYDILKRKPQFLQNYKESILQAYRNAVDPNNVGKVNLNAHQRFINDYKYALETFFGKNGYKEITTVGNLAKKVEATAARRNDLMKKLGTTTKGKLENLDPDKIFSYVYNNNTPTTTKKVISIIKEDKDLLNAFQTVTKNDLMFKTTDNRGKFVFEKFADYMKNNKQILTETFVDNPQYVKDLDMFRDALEITSRKSAQKTIGKAETALNDIIRARLGQFTVAGRTFTALKKIVRSDIDKQLTEIIIDPARLEDLVKLKAVKPGSPAAKQIISRLFGYYIFDQQFFEDDEFTPTMIDFIDSQKVSEAVTDVEEGDDNKELAQLERPTLPLNLGTSTAAPGAMPPDTGQGLASIQTRQDYGSLFPQDVLGEAIAKRGMA